MNAAHRQQTDDLDDFDKTLTPEEREALKMHAVAHSPDPLESGIAAVLAENEELRAALEQARTLLCGKYERDGDPDPVCADCGGDLDSDGNCKRDCACSHAEARICAWAWDKAEQRWMTSCGYGFTPASDRDHTGAVLPFPFCPYCGAQIRKPNAGAVPRRVGIPNP